MAQVPLHGALPVVATAATGSALTAQRAAARLDKLQPTTSPSASFRRTWHLLRLAALSGILLQMSLGPQALAVTRSCSWSITDIPVFVNRQSFVDRGYDGDDVTTAVINAVSVWYEEGQANLRPFYAGDTTSAPIPGQITVLMEDWIGNTGPGWCGALAYATIATGNCDSGAYVAVFDQINQNGGAVCGNRPINWATHGYPSKEYISMQSVLVHELGHSFGFSDDYNNMNSVMQGAGQGTSGPAHLYKTDISLLRDGVQPGNVFAQGARTSNTLRNKYSTNTTSWTLLTPAIGSTNLTPGAAANGSDYVVAFVDAATQNIKTRKSDGYFTDTPVTLADKSHTGVALTRGTSNYVLAFVEDADAGRIGIRRSADGVTWGATSFLPSGPSGVKSRTPPSLTRTQTTNQLILMWADGRADVPNPLPSPPNPPTVQNDANMDMLMYSFSNDDGATWTTAQTLLADAPEFRTLAGVSLSCRLTANECIAVNSSWGTYRNVWPGGSICAYALAVVSGPSIMVNEIRCGGPNSWGVLPEKTTNSGRAPGIAFGSTGSFTGWVMARAGRDAATAMNTQRRSSFNLDPEWDDPVVHAESLRAGVASVFSSGWAEWEVFYVSP